MVTVGVTGGIGSGKTTVCRIWQSLGAFTLNADDLAKRIMVENADVKREIQETFGEESYRPDGSLNRGYLAEKAFGEGRVEELNAIVHPRIPGRTREIMERARSEGYPVFVYEAALLLENLQPGQLDYVVLVLANRNKRLERVVQRDDANREAILERMEKQQEFEELTHLADFTIRNDGSRAELEEKAKALYQTFLEKKKNLD